MNKKLRFFFACALFSSAAFALHAHAQLSPFSFVTNALSDIESHISEKNSELQKIKEQRDSLQRNLDAVSEVGSSLKKDIQTYNTSINQLNLSLKSSDVHIQKLGLEINELGSNIQNISHGIGARKQAIANLISELQQEEHESLIERILKSESLSQSITKIENVKTLNDALSTNISELKDLQGEYSNKLQETKQKKTEREIQKENITNLQQIVKEQKTEKQKLLEVTKSQEKYYQEQLDALDKRQEEISNTIEDAEQRIRLSFNSTLLPVKRNGVLVFPLESPYLTQCYGPTTFASRAYRTKSHGGIDFGTPVGTPVFAPASGKVVKVGNNDRGTSRWSRYQYGRYIVIQHENNLATLYGHLSRQLVSEGQQVEKGTIIGYSGNTGYSFGPHLHFGVYWAPTIQYKSIPPAAGLVPVGVTVDPTDYLPDISDIPKGGDSGCR